LQQAIYPHQVAARNAVPRDPQARCFPGSEAGRSAGRPVETYAASVVLRDVKKGARKGAPKAGTPFLVRGNGRDCGDSLGH
jgi:hypothetical protein